MRRELADPEAWFVSRKGRRGVLDEVHRLDEIVATPKVYGVDTGFVAYHRGWNSLRREDRGILWEHYVLNEIHAHTQARDVRYWAAWW